MLHMQNELANVLQQDRRSEVEAARKIASLSVADSSKRRLVPALSAMVKSIKRSPTRTQVRTQPSATTSVT